MFVFCGAQVQVQSITIVLELCCWKCTCEGWDLEDRV